MRLDAIIFDFDGVLLESEYELNRVMAELLTGLGHPTTAEEATRHFTGLSGQQFVDAVEAGSACRFRATSTTACASAAGAR